MVKGGDYEMTIRYATAEPRQMSLSVNGGTEQQLTNLNSGGYTTWKETTVKVNLKKGQNTVRLGNAKAFAPNIDCITLKKTGK